MTDDDRRYNQGVILVAMALAVVFMIAFLLAIAAQNPATIRLRTSCDADKAGLKSTYYTPVSVP